MEEKGSPTVTFVSCARGERSVAAGRASLKSATMAATVGMGKKKRNTSRAPVQRRPQQAPPAATTDDGGQILMPERTMVKGRWRIERQLAKGAFGQISVARDLQANRLVAVKSEAINAQMTFLRMEVTVLRALQTKTRQVPRFVACGHTPEVNYLIMQLLGPSVMELKKKTMDDRFSIGTSIRVADQMICALQSLHDIGYVHRDVKPSNFVVGAGKDVRTVFMLDFGLCRQYVDPVTGKQRPPRMRCGFRGTVRYACIDTLKSLDVGRDGDLWSLYYVLVEMINGQLPWRRIIEKHQALEWKESISPANLLHGEPVELRELVEHIQSLDFYGRPEYERLRSIFAKILARSHITEDVPMDWEPLIVDNDADVGDQNRGKQESEKSERTDDENASVASERGVNDVEG